MKEVADLMPYLNRHVSTCDEDQFEAESNSRISLGKVEESSTDVDRLPDNNTILSAQCDAMRWTQSGPVHQREFEFDSVAAVRKLSDAHVQ